ncbi:DUF5047 domain-containing protein [Glycomyces sp. A-F 0318]|uniref:DUF5047 domain-containing protein n=1 Tax=Glycomyces amatae TaxID=2881355 RepID=UPI001E3CB2DD|nr:DUF5047 domain-containing protein [Glycomyces amatae]MCD0446454.1 DUF5047 domain-containing protein [Glycomyces amatae]
MAVPDVLFQDVTAGSHTARIEARLLTRYQTGPDPDGHETLVLGGDVAFDAGADIYATAELTAKGAWPRTAASALAPYGNEIFLRRGIDLGGVGGTIWSELGYFRITEPTGEGDGVIRVGLEDRMAGLIDARFLTPRVIAKGRTIGNVARDLVEAVYPLAEVVFDDAAEFATLKRDVIVEKDRYQFLADLAASLGKVMFWDGTGRLQFRTPAPATAPRWRIGAGPGGILIRAEQRLSRQGVYNAVVARGEGAGEETAALGIAIDDNPASPTYFSGRFGQVPKFYSSPLLADDAGARAAAATMLANQLGVPYTANLTAVCNPAVRPWDPVLVTTKDGDRERHVLTKVTVPLTVDSALTANTSEQTHVTVRTYTP